MVFDHTTEAIVLEIIQDGKNKIVLHNKDTGEVFVEIEFHEKIHEIVGEDLRGVGHQMVQSAIAYVMHEQIQRMRAHVYEKNDGYIH